MVFCFFLWFPILKDRVVVRGDHTGRRYQWLGNVGFMRSKRACGMDPSDHCIASTLGSLDVVGLGVDRLSKKDGIVPFAREAMLARSDAHEERLQANSKDLYDTIPRGTFSSVILVVFVLRFVYYMSNCSVRNIVTIDNK
jgi:hypothetical protein